MNLVILNAGADTAGCGIGLKRAFDRYAPGWNARAICRDGTYLDYPTDIVWPLGTPQPTEVAELVAQADVVHVMDHEYALANHSNVRGKVIVVHHLGTNFRRAPAKVSRFCRRYGAREVTDSLDLAVLGNVPWLPVPADLDAIAPLRDGYQPSDRIRIAHAPTNRAIKSTDVIERTVRDLAQRYPIDFDLIERVSNAECLERKAQADIFIDELTLGFGLNFLECAAMGIPVVSGLADPKARALALGMWGELPWEDATADTLSATVERLVVDAGLRTQVGERGRLHAQRWHSQAAVVTQTLAVYG